MKVTVIKNTEEEKKDNSVIFSFIMLALGIFMLINANGIMTIVFDILGAILVLIGAYRFIYYQKMKKQFNTDDSVLLVSGVTLILVGLLVILLSNVLNNALQIVTGIWLFFIGLNKINGAIMFKEVNNSLFIQNIIGAILLILLGIYTIFANNVLFMVIGIILIITAVYDIFTFYVRKTK